MGVGPVARRDLVRVGALLLVFLVGFLKTACTKEVELPGTHLDKVAAPGFRLTDQRGNSVTLADQRGKAVILTFMYTTCPDFCPLTAAKIRQTFDKLGKDGDKVVAVAVSVDPERDDAAAAQRFTELHRLTDVNWHYLVGREEELAPVWAAYAVGRVPRGQRPTPGSSVTDAVGHTEAIYIIDKEGRERTLLRGDFDPTQLAASLQQLVR